MIGHHLLHGRGQLHRASLPAPSMMIGDAAVRLLLQRAVKARVSPSLSSACKPVRQNL
jgi:hypothetical protein